MAAIRIAGLTLGLALSLALCGALPALAQSTPPSYGAPIGLDVAKKAMAAAESAAETSGAPVAIVILDSGGNIVMIHRRDDALLGSIDIAQGKARTALMFKRPSKALDEAISAGGVGLRFLAIKDMVPLEGGFPLIADGKIVGAIGVSGALSAQNARIGEAGVDALR